MKKIICGVLLYALLPRLSMAQAMKDFDTMALIKPYHIQVSSLKTTVILFPNPIRSVDRGSKFVLAEKVKEAENVLKLKAERPGLPESNLSVLTADGKLYSFIVDDTDNLPYQAIDLRRQEQHEKTLALFAAAGLNEVQIKDIAASITLAHPFMHNKDKNDHMRFELEGIYMAKDVLFCRFSLSNRSHIDYTLDFARFYIRDKKKIKRMAVQEQEITPLQQYPDTAFTVDGKSHRIIVIAFKKFTIADGKNLAIELFEKNGDRQLSLEVSGNELLKARAIK